MSVNSDSVMRSVFYKYLHPKEVFIAEGVLVPDIARKKVTDTIDFISVSFILYTSLCRMCRLYQAGRRIQQQIRNQTLPYPRPGQV